MMKVANHLQSYIQLIVHHLLGWSLALQEHAQSLAVSSGPPWRLPASPRAVLVGLGLALRLEIDCVGMAPHWPMNVDGG